MGNNKLTGGTKPALIAPVILCPVHRILWQQVTNLVNKFVILLQRSMFTHDSRNKSENNECRGRGNSVCCKFFKFHSEWEATGLLRCARNDERQGEVGKSMIEMLGVLAIIGVLSVGGIAGYSKAMEKFKINKTIEQYSYLTAGLISNLNEFKKLNCTTDWKANWQKCGLRDYVLAANLVPADWHGNSAINQLIDSEGNMVNVFSRRGNLVLDFHLGGFSYNDKGTGITPYFPVKLCRALMSDLAQPLHSVVQYVWIYKSGATNPLFYGDNYCGEGQKCLNNLTLEEINNECHGCEGGVQSCTVTLEF